jgi:polysaccharide deacetylase 2 family uncharacterized protein YibQ
LPTDELTKPLGLTPRPRSFRPGAFVVAVVAMVLAGAVSGGAWWATAQGPAAAVAVASAPVAPPRPPVEPPPVVAATPAKPAAGAPVLPPAPALTEVTANGPPVSGAGVVIRDPAQAAPAPLPATPDSALLENGTYGPLPRIAASGARPLDAYARPLTHDDGGARIAIVVGGIGLDPATTRSAIAMLPGNVSLALVPYGSDLKQTVGDARADGHELLLQIPLEPYGYPKTDPGPRTLTVAAPAATTLDDLSWFLSRATNYVGVVNYMGAAFTSAPQPLSTLLDAVGKRGLLYLDDGSSPRSLARDLASGRTPFLKADLVLDPDLTPAAIDARLEQLVAIAKSRGQAIATATAFPVTIDRIAAFARTAAARDVTLVPVTALVRGAPRT